MSEHEEKTCFNPALTLAWLFSGASLLTSLAAFIHDDWRGVWVPVVYMAISLPYLAIHYRAKFRERRR